MWTHGQSFNLQKVMTAISAEVTEGYDVIRGIKDICHIKYGTLQGEINMIKQGKHLFNQCNDMREAEISSNL